MSGLSPGFVVTPRLWLLRLMDGLCAQAQADLRRMRAHPSVSIHALRVRMKKLAAVLRLADGRLAKVQSKRLRQRMNGIKNAFAEHRDVEVMQQQIQRLAQRHHLPRPKLLTPLQMVPPSASISSVHRRLSALRKDLAALPLQDLTQQEVIASYASRERACRREMKECRSNPAPERLHAWRKRIKQWYYLNLVLHRLPHAARSVTPARRLGRQLGEVHDLVLLYARITGPHEAAWHDAIAKRMNKLEERVFAQAKHAFRFRHSRLLKELTTEAEALMEKSRRDKQG